MQTRLVDLIPNEVVFEVQSTFEKIKFEFETK